MPYIMIRNERKVADVLARAYGATLKPADAKRAEEAIRAANPHVEAVRDLPSGTVLVVPDLPGLSASPADREQGADALALDAAEKSLASYQAHLGARLEEERAAIDASTVLLKSADFKALARKLPESSEYLTRAAQSLKDRTTEHKERSALLDALPALKADFEAMRKRIG